MNTRSKSTSNPLKPYKTNNIRLSHTDTAMAEKDINVPPAANHQGKKITEMSVDEKLDMLINKVSKLETVPTDIVTIQTSITEIQNDLKAIPVLKEQIKTIEDDLRQQKIDISTDRNTTAALEVSVTNTQKDVDDFRDKFKKLQTQMEENKILIKDFESKIKHDEKKIDDLTKNALEEEIENSKVAKKIQIQGIPEDRHENLNKIAQQIMFDTGIKVHPLEIDEVFREGKFNKRKTRPIIVTLTKTSTRNEILKNRNNIKRNPNCKNVWVNEVVHDKVRQQRNELHAIHLLAQKNGHQSKHVLDIVTIDGIAYSHNTIHKLPADLTLELAFSREYNDQLFFNSEHIFLSNFHPCKIVLEDAICSSLEQAYYYLMAKDIGDLKSAQSILKTQSPRAIKVIGGMLNVSKQWLDKADQVMFDLLTIKYSTNPDLKAKLLATGNKRLVESTMNRVPRSTTQQSVRRGRHVQRKGRGWRSRLCLKLSLRPLRPLRQPEKAPVEDHLPPREHRPLHPTCLPTFVRRPPPKTTRHLARMAGTILGAPRQDTRPAVRGSRTRES